jgi:mono/diheme cytochrome c family protein/glucose/arabinose dehydrogenase
MRPAASCFGLALCFALPAQNGDRAGETQTPLPDSVVVPPAIVRSPAEEQATMRVQPGFAVELVASEPLVSDPVAAAFDPAGRLWVAEMRGFMNDVDATNEHAPVGRIVVLHDRDHDGCMEDRTVFLDGLVLPRAVLPLRGGALVIEPPNLIWCPDRDGDLHADGKEIVMGGFEAGLENPEHSGNGLLWGLDGRIHLADDKRMLRWTPGGFVIEAGAGGGQWGITHDDRGRFYFNYNEDWLRCDLVPGRYGPAAADAGGLPGLNHRLLQDTSVWPIHITPGVNRGYQPGRLRDYVLVDHTAVCGPHVHRGDLLPGCDGDAFVCEPAGNLVRRIRLSDQDGRMRGENVYQPQQQEFLASTDERFRPVNLFGGPDGAVYLLDMYRGVIQHKNFVTSYLRRQILGRKLEQPIGLGRIWRIVPAGATVPAAPSLQDAPVAQLVDAMAATSGTVRDLALRELVQRQERGAAPALRARLREHARAGCRIGLLAALQGLGALETMDLRAALHDEDPGVLAFALQYLAGPLQKGDGLAWTQLERLFGKAPSSVVWQAALTLGEVLSSRGAARFHARAIADLASLLQRPGDDALLRGAVIAAAGEQKLAVLRTFTASLPEAAVAGQEAALRDLARALLRTRKVDMQLAVFDLAAAAGPPWQQRALLAGCLAALPKAPARQGWLTFPATPTALLSIVRAANPGVTPLANELLGTVALQAGDSVVAEAALSPVDQQRVAAGQRVFATSCAACHQLDGNGMAGLAPPLRESEWVAGPPERTLRIVLHGLRGPVEVGGTTFQLEMPGQGHLPDKDLAAALSYVRRSFGNRASLVTPEEVAAFRKANARRTEPWTIEELLGVK